MTLWELLIRIAMKGVLFSEWLDSKMGSLALSKIHSANDIDFNFNSWAWANSQLLEWVSKKIVRNKDEELLKKEIQNETMN